MFCSQLNFWLLTTTANKTTNGVLREAVKGKPIPLPATTGPQGSSRLSLPDFKTIVT